MSALIRRNRIFAHSSSWICRERLGDPDPKSKLPSSPHPCPTSSSKLKLRAELRRTVVHMQATHLKFRRQTDRPKKNGPDIPQSRPKLVAPSSRSGEGPSPGGKCASSQRVGKCIS